MRRTRTQTWLALCLLAALAIGPRPAAAATDERYFTTTGHSVVGKFLAYWDAHGGLAQFGYPISDEMNEVSDLDGKSYGVQYFERAEFEHHPENVAPYDVELAQLGTMRYQQIYPNGATGQQASPSNPYTFAATGKTIGGAFRAYWEQHGGLAQFGYPISNEFQEISDLNGQSYTVQYFERAEFEYHPENQPPYDVLLSQLGTMWYKAKQSGEDKPPLIIPVPDGNYKLDVEIAGNNIVWGGRYAVGPYGSAIRSYNLSTKRTTTLTTRANGYAIDRSVIVWAELSTSEDNSSNKNCFLSCTSEIMGADLDTGQRFNIYQCDGQCGSILISGRTAVWDKYEDGVRKMFAANLDVAGASQFYVCSKNCELGALNDKTVVLQDTEAGVVTLSAINVDTRVAKVVTSVTLPTDNYYWLDTPLISNSYIVWFEHLQNGHYGDPYKLFAYNISTAMTETVGTFTNSAYTPPPQYTLQGSKLAWTQSAWGIFYTDLDTNQTTSISGGYAEAPMIEGDLILWSGAEYFGMGRPTCQIRGFRFSTGKVMQITNSLTDKHMPLIINDLLVWWHGDEEVNNISIVGVPLSQAFDEATNIP